MTIFLFIEERPIVKLMNINCVNYIIYWSLRDRKKYFVSLLMDHPILS